MARGKKLREVSPAYAAKPISEVFWLAFKSLSEEDQAGFLRLLLNDPEYYEEIADAVTMIESENEPARLFDEFYDERQRERA